MRKAKKVENIENFMLAMRKNFDFHFFINGKTVDNPYFKLDALVWGNVFHSKVPRYSDQVYKVSSYLVSHLEYLKSLSFEDIERCQIDWNAARVPVNYKDYILKHSPPLSREEFEREEEGPHTVKKFHYNYNHPSEMSEENLKKTFINLVTKNHFEKQDKTVREEDINFDFYNAKEKDEMMFRLKRQIDDYRKMPHETLKDAYNSASVSAQYNVWKNQMFTTSGSTNEEIVRRRLESE